ncbi:polysaccharide pyruvyl transferase family protein [Rhodococcus wratislaviensis]|uniref:Polysaccharide pyruvyl transferase domain-containing protein n=1 Tax=Rhodococcus wratislaviensis NBRC 100605 TaxID=1219028 RepID=X0Q8B3_RHOWR|nr:polysaccharide pyruvyl transferase family protein [Rhodococcus wratislaviensis]GAF47071.1 hypothetical protein RW1_036_00980 [Rhodococcus wratislaviensis NBRC 100605]
MIKHLKSLASSYLFVSIELILLRACVCIGAFGSRSDGDSRILLLNPPGAGNIGDQAMFESFVQNSDAPVTAIVRSKNAYDYQNLDGAKGFDVCRLQNLVYGRGLSQWRDGFRFGRALRGCSAFGVLGADLMDGCYGLRPSAVQWLLCLASQDAGRDVRVVGFSWNSKANRHIVRLARAASRRGADLILRDPDSFQRIVDHGIESPTNSADVVFLLNGAAPEWDLYRSLNSIRVQGRRLALVNVSGLIGSRYDQVPEYVAILKYLISENYAVALVPHVSHRSSDDIVAQDLVWQGIDSRWVIKVDRLLKPREVRLLASIADLVVTGRMHLSILALSEGVPCVVFSTSGKVSGLMSMMDMEGFAIEPQTGCGQSVIDCVEYVHEHRSEVLARIESGVSTARRLAAVNFTGPSGVAS